MRVKILTAVAAVLQATAFAAVAQEPDTMRDPTRPESRGQHEPQHLGGRQKMMMETVDTETFVEKAANGSMAEVEISQLALQKSQDEGIREFAQRMVDDHTAANEELKVVATEENIEVPSGLDHEHQGIVERMRKLEGEAFDHEYRKRMKEDHAEAIALFESASQSPQVSEEVRQFASSTLPTLQEHGEMLEEMEMTTGSGAGSTGDPQEYQEELPPDAQQQPY